MSRFQSGVLGFPRKRRSHPIKMGVCLFGFPIDFYSQVLVFVLQSTFGHVNAVDECRIYSIDPREHVTRPF